jgi:ornithine cyclodeaminase/alanine dehydrogenase-like protein (mu-crystallin family)
MHHISPEALDRLLDFPSLIEALAGAFMTDHVAPARHHHRIGAASHHATHLLMTAWSADTPGAHAFLGTKIVNVFGDNWRLNLPSVLATYLLQSGETGAPLAIMDGSRLTLWRTAAASALAARYLARADASHLVMVGAGALAPFMIRAHASSRPIKRVTIWNHRQAGAERLAASLSAEPWSVTVADDLRQAVADADIVSCATLTEQPLIRGEWLRNGTHVDLVGAFNLSMRECDDAAVVRARIFVDTPAAKTEGGDVAVALNSGIITDDAIVADLYDLCRQRRRGRRSASEITLFKSVGTAIEDLAAAMLVWQRTKDRSAGRQL